MKKKRHSYSKDERKLVIDFFERLPGKIQDRISKINSIPGYEKITHKSIRGWAKSKKRIGRAVSVEFESEVAADLLIFRLSESGDTDIIANSIYSYECVKSAASYVRDKNEKWKSDPLTMSLKFSNKWVKGFLNRMHFTKRRVTAAIKVETPVHVVQAQMSRIQDFITSEKICTSCIFNADETGVNWAPQLQHQYIAGTAARAVAPPGDESGRFTAMLGGSATGEMLPMYLIVKCSCKSTLDLSKSTILKKFFGAGKMCKPDEGWTEGIWTANLTIKGIHSTLSS